MNIRNKKLLYHLTHIDNLDNIIRHGLLPRNLATDFIEVDVANQDILNKRQHNHLDDYVLFHFHPYTAFDVYVKDKYGSENFVYIAIWRDYARNNCFEVIPKHPLNGIFEKYDYDEGIDQIDWGIMEKKQNEILYTEQNYAKEVKMAECISEEPINPNDFAYIYCNKRRVNELQYKYPELAAKIKEGVWL